MRERGNYENEPCHLRRASHLLTPLILLMILILSLSSTVKAETITLNKTEAYSYFMNNPILNDKNITILNPSCDGGAIPLENGFFKWNNVTINSYIMFEPKNSTTIITNSKLNNAIFTLREPSNLTIDHSLINFTADVVCENGNNTYYSNGVYIADDIAFDDNNFFNWIDNGGILDNKIIINNSRIIIDKSKPVVSAQNWYLYNTSNGARTTSWASGYDEQRIISYKNVVLENSNITFVNSTSNSWGGYSQFTKLINNLFKNNASRRVYVSSVYSNLNFFYPNILFYSSSPIMMKNNICYDKVTLLRSVDVWNTTNWQPIHIKQYGGVVENNVFYSDLNIVNNNLDVFYNVFNNSVISVSGSNNVLCHNTYYNTNDTDNCNPSSSSGNEITGGFVGAVGNVKNILIALIFVFLLVLFDAFTYEEKDINRRINLLVIFIILFGLLISLIFIL